MHSTYVWPCLPWSVKVKHSWNQWVATTGPLNCATVTLRSMFSDVWLAHKQAHSAFHQKGNYMSRRDVGKVIHKLCLTDQLRRKQTTVQCEPHALASLFDIVGGGHRLPTLVCDSFLSPFCWTYGQNIGLVWQCGTADMAEIGKTFSNGNICRILLRCRSFKCLTTL